MSYLFQYCGLGQFSNLDVVQVQNCVHWETGESVHEE